jgi:wyosine [tRNA(Phe)-imidazoG37] synthetase (radical SAM superfamily)
MSTFLFDSIVFGPVRSRRLGASLGINLLPVDRKVCSFNCIYCECGWTPAARNRSPLPSRKEVYEALEKKLAEMKDHDSSPDVITYAGNGEPTLHPDFPGIIEDSLALRDRFFPMAKIAILSNGTGLHRASVREALKKADMNILKIDSAFPETIRKLNQPHARYDLQAFEKYVIDFDGRFIIQTMFVRGEYLGESIDNSVPAEVDAWLKVIERLRPQSVMIYTIERDTPLGRNLRKVPLNELKAIAARVEAMGIHASVSG